MADRPKRKVEFIESYWTGGELGADYQWNDNHGELIRWIASMGKSIILTL